MGEGKDRGTPVPSEAIPTTNENVRIMSAESFEIGDAVRVVQIIEGTIAKVSPAGKSVLVQGHGNWGADWYPMAIVEKTSGPVVGPARDRKAASDQPNEPTVTSGAPATAPEDAGTSRPVSAEAIPKDLLSPFRHRHLKCSMLSGTRVYKHDPDCQHQDEERDLMPVPAVPEDVNSRLAAAAPIDTQTGDRADELTRLRVVAKAAERTLRRWPEPGCLHKDNVALRDALESWRKGST